MRPEMDVMSIKGRPLVVGCNINTTLCWQAAVLMQYCLLGHCQTVTNSVTDLQQTQPFCFSSQVGAEPRCPDSTAITPPPPPRNPHANFPLCLLLLHPLSTFPLPCSLSPPPLLSFASTFLDIRSGRRRSAYSFYSAVHIPLPRPGRSLSPHSRRPPLLLPLPTLRAHSSFCLIACRGLFYRGAH